MIILLSQKEQYWAWRGQREGQLLDGELIKKGCEKVNWRKAATQDRIDFCDRRLIEANAIYVATINQQQQAAAPTGSS